MTIDAHQHFWRYNANDFGWINESMEAIRRDFLPADLEPWLKQAAVDGVISVQARQSLEETHWLLELADQNQFIRGVVGWVPLVSADVGTTLETLAANPKLKGVRHVIHDEPDDQFILREDFNRGVSLLREMNLTYDILIFEKHLPQTIEFVDRHPEQVFIVDHIAKPRIRENKFSPWRENLKELGRRPNVYCKISGMVTEANWYEWTRAKLQPYFDATLEAFGPGRLMFGSDWPVCLIACGYSRWRQVVEEFAGKLSTDERGQLMGETAAKVYRVRLTE